MSVRQGLRSVSRQRAHADAASAAAYASASAAACAAAACAPAVPASPAAPGMPDVLVLGMAFVSAEHAAKGNARPATTIAVNRDRERLLELERALPRHRIMSFNHSHTQDQCEPHLHMHATFGWRSVVEMEERFDAPLRFSAIYADYFRFPGEYMRQAYGKFLAPGGGMLAKLIERGCMAPHTELIMPHLSKLHAHLPGETFWRPVQEEEQQGGGGMAPCYLQFTPLSASEYPLYSATDAILPDLAQHILGGFSNAHEIEQLHPTAPFIKITLTDDRRVSEQSYQFAIARNSKHVAVYPTQQQRAASPISPPSPPSSASPSLSPSPSPSSGSSERATSRRRSVAGGRRVTAPPPKPSAPSAAPEVYMASIQLNEKGRAKCAQPEVPVKPCAPMVKEESVASVPVAASVPVVPAAAAVPTTSGGARGKKRAAPAPAAALALASAAVPAPAVVLPPVPMCALSSLPSPPTTIVAPSIAAPYSSPQKRQRQAPRRWSP